MRYTMLCWILLLTFQFQMCGKIIIDMRTKCKQRRYSIQGIIEMICGEHCFWLLPLASQAKAVIVKIEQARNKEPSFRHRLLKAKTMLLLSHNRSTFSCPHCNMFRDWIGCFFNWLFFFFNLQKHFKIDRCDSMVLISNDAQSTFCFIQLFKSHQFWFMKSNYLTSILQLINGSVQQLMEALYYK